MIFKETDVPEQLQRFWQWVVGIQHWNTPEGWIARILEWVLMVYLLVCLAKINNIRAAGAKAPSHCDQTPPPPTASEARIVRA